MASGFTHLNLNKMFESNRKWNLANDVELLKCLETISQNIINNATSALNSMDNLEDSLNETYLTVRTVANKFQAIADNQFIENRVQEEEDFVLANDNRTEPLESQITSETSKTQLFESIKDCQNVLSKKFETIQLSGIDSEDEMANSSPVVLIPKNVYKERRLPHLIGGEQFISDETLGLIDGDNSVEDVIESEEDIDEPDKTSFRSVATMKSLHNIARDPLLAMEKEGFPINSSPMEDDFPIISARPNDDLPINVSSLKDDFLINTPSEKDDFFTTPPPVKDDFLTTKPPVKDDIFTPAPPVKDDFFSTASSVKTVSPNASIEPNSEPFMQPSIQIKGGFLSSHFNSNIFEDDEKESSNDKEALPVPESPVVPEPASVVSREHLLAGRNFASFKDDLSRVLSNAKPYKKKASFDSDSSIQSPITEPFSSKTDDGVQHFPQSKNNTSTPQSPVSVSSNSANVVNSPLSYNENSSSVLLPHVSTNVLENLSKGRAKVNTKRRPPSRKHRQASGKAESGSLSQDLKLNSGNSAHSEDASTQESVSTQPGSNILSPATDEEDLFVLPAFDLPMDPPSRGLFFGNSLLSPGTTIDDGATTNSPLFPNSLDDHAPTDEHTSPAEINITKQVPQIGASHDVSVSEKIQEPISSVMSNPLNVVQETRDPMKNDVLTDLFASTSTTKVGKDSASKSETRYKPNLYEPSTDLFSESSTSKLDAMFSTGSGSNTISSSPPLFSEWNVHPASLTNKNSKSSLGASPKWDLLVPDDNEDLFRSTKKDRSVDTGAVTEKKDDGIFSFAPDKSDNRTLFVDDNLCSATDIFSNNSSFMGLSLPSRRGDDSLFASDDDDDSLFKSSRNNPVSTASTAKPLVLATAQEKSSTKPNRSSLQESINDPLSALDQLE